MTDWSQYRWYRCHVCHQPCINHVDEERTQDTECAYCFQIPSLDQEGEGPVIDDRRAVESARRLALDG